VVSFSCFVQGLEIWVAVVGRGYLDDLGDVVEGDEPDVFGLAELDGCMGLALGNQHRMGAKTYT
jgi:hypothetical protein